MGTLPKPGQTLRSSSRSGDCLRVHPRPVGSRCGAASHYCETSPARMERLRAPQILNTSCKTAGPVFTFTPSQPACMLNNLQYIPNPWMMVQLHHKHNGYSMFAPTPGKRSSLNLELDRCTKLLPRSWRVFLLEPKNPSNIFKPSSST